VVNGKEELYQEGKLARLMAPKELMAFIRSKIGAPLDGTIMFSGTMATLNAFDTDQSLKIIIICKWQSCVNATNVHWNAPPAKAFSSCAIRSAKPTGSKLGWRAGSMIYPRQLPTPKLSPKPAKWFGSRQVIIPVFTNSCDIQSVAIGSSLKKLS